MDFVEKKQALAAPLLLWHWNDECNSKQVKADAMSFPWFNPCKASKHLKLLYAESEGVFHKLLCAVSKGKFQME